MIFDIAADQQELLFHTHTPRKHVQNIDDRHFQSIQKMLPNPFRRLGTVVRRYKSARMLIATRAQDSNQREMESSGVKAYSPQKVDQGYDAPDGGLTFILDTRLAWRDGSRY